MQNYKMFSNNDSFGRIIHKKALKIRVAFLIYVVVFHYSEVFRIVLCTFPRFLKRYNGNILWETRFMHKLLLFLPSDLVRQVRHIEALCLSQSRECRKFKTFQRESIVATHLAWTLFYFFEKGLSYNLRLRTNIVSSTLL